MAEAIRADVAWRLARALAPEEGNGQSQVGTATVTRVDADGTVWVRIPGSVIDTPANGTVTAAAEPGHTVGYRIESGRLSVTGNASSPAVGDTYVTQVVEPVERKADEAMDEAWRAHTAADAAEMDARRAKGAADAAQESADDAADAAESAQQSATTANRAANDALTQLSFVEDVAGTLDWIQSHGTFTATTDTTVQEGKVYFELVSGDYAPVASPSGNPSQQGWYELDVTDSQTDYIMAHLAVTSAGLWVLPSGIDGTDAQHSSGYKALLANDGMRVYDGDGALVSTFGESVTFDANRPQRIGNSTAYVEFSPTGGGSVTIVGANVYTKAESDAAIDSISIGARNLLRHSDEPKASSEYTIARGAVDADGVIRLTPTSSYSYAASRSRYLDYSEFAEDVYTLSFDARFPDAETSYTDRHLGVYIAYSDADAWSGMLSSNLHHVYARRYFEDLMTGDWQRFSFTADPIADKVGGTLAPTAGCSLRVEFYVSGSRVPVEIRRVKLERGNKATDWSPAPEDAERNPNILRCTNQYVELTPFGVDGAQWSEGNWGVGSETSANGNVELVQAIDAPDGQLYAFHAWSVNSNNKDATQRGVQDALAPDTQYQVSYYARLTPGVEQESAVAQFRLYGYQSAAATSMTAIKTSAITLDSTEWKLFTYNFTLTEANFANENKGKNFLLGVRGVGDVQFCGVKLEQSDYVTGWAPSPFDSAAASNVGEIESRVTTVEQTADGIVTTVSSISSAKYLTSTVASWTLPNVLEWAAEGHSASWSVTSTDGVRVGDTVYVKGHDSTRDCDLYAKGTVTAVTSGSVTMVGHGYTDVLPVNSAISTINQSAETVKIAASKVEITGDAVFSAINNDTGTTKINGGKIDAASITIGGSNLATQSDVGTAVEAIEVGGRNLLRYRVYDYADANSVVGVNSAYRGMYCAVDGGETYTVSRRVIEGNRFWIDWSEQEPAAGVALHSLSKDNTALKVTVDVPSEANWLFIYLSNQSDVISNGNIKVERGTKPTDWTPAPEDVDADISAAQQAAIDAIPDPTDFYGTCDTLAGTAAKVVVCDGFVASTGARLTVKFSTANTANVPTLTIKDSTEAVLMSATAVHYNGTASSSTNPIRWGASATLHFVYDGTVWALDEKPPSYSTTSSTAAATRDKAGTASGALVVNGTRVTIRFSSGNTYPLETTTKNYGIRLNLSATGVMNIYRDNAVTSQTNTLYWDANTVLTFTQQGGSWHLADNGTRTMSEEAAKTATNYISADSSGIRIADADPATATTYQHQTATSTEFVVEGDSLLEMDGTNGVRVGDASGSHVLVDSDSMDIYDGANRAAGFSASFEEDADAGTSAAYATIEIGSDPNVALSSTRQDWGEGDTKAHISIHALADGADVESAVKASSYAETQMHLKGLSSTGTPHGDGGTYEYVSYDSSVTLAGQALIIDDQYSAGTRKYYYSMTDVASLLEKMLTPATDTWTLATGVSSATIHSCRNNGVTLSVYGQNVTLASSLAVGGQVVIGNLAAGFRPPEMVHVPALSYQANVSGAIVQISAGGVITLTNRSSAAIATSTRIAFVATVTP